MPVNDVWHPIFSLIEDYHSKNYFFFYLQDLILDNFVVVVEIAELREIQSSRFTPPSLFFFWDTDLQDFFLAEIETPGI